MNNDCIPKKAHTGSELKRTRSGELKTHQSGAVLTAKFNRDGNFILTAGEDKVIRIWDTGSGNLLNSFLEHEREVRDVCVTADDSKLSSCGGDGQVSYWDLSTQRLVRKFGGHNDAVNAVKFNEFGSVIVSADNCVRLWDCRSSTREPIQIFDTFEDSVTSLCVKRTEIIAASNDGSVQKFDLRNKKRFSHKCGAPVTCISLASEGEKSILASCRDSTIKFCSVDMNGIRPVGEYKGHTCESSKVGCCFTHGTTNVVGGSEDGRIFIWDMLSGGVVSESHGHSSAVTSVDVHPTNNCMISASMDGSVVLWKKAI